MCFFTSFERTSNTAASSGEDSPRMRIMTGNLETVHEQRPDNHDVDTYISLISTKYSNRHILVPRTGALGSGLRERVTVTVPGTVACGSTHEIKSGFRTTWVLLDGDQKKRRGCLPHGRNYLRTLHRAVSSSWGNQSLRSKSGVHQ